MSRSIHHTRKTLIENGKFDYSDDSLKKGEMQKIWSNLSKKQRIKQGALAERSKPPEPLPEALPDSIPITILDQGPYIHYPATPQDILEVMRRLIPGAVSGLKSIELYLGREMMEEMERADEGDCASGPQCAPDPYVSRLSHEYLPGVYRPRSLGVYHRRDASIQIAAYVYDPALPQRERGEALLKCHMLSTLVHEIAHHCDATRRVARGRWRMDDREKGEAYAEQLQSDWAHHVVVPYVQEAYPEAVQALLEWIETHSGVRVTLAMLMGDEERIDERHYRYHDPIELAPFAFALESGDSAGARLCFVEALYRADHLELALNAAQKILTEDPTCVRALMLKGCALGGMNRHDEAKALALQAIALEPAQYRAWEALTKAQGRLKQWTEAIKAAEESIRLRIAAGQALHPETMIIRSVARLKLGDHAGLREDIAQLELRPESWARDLIRLIEGDIKEILEEAKTPSPGDPEAGV